MTDLVVAVISANPAHRQALDQYLSDLGYPHLLVPHSVDLAPFAESLADDAAETICPWRLSDCSLAIVDATEDDDNQTLPAIERALDAVADLPTLYLDKPLPATPSQQDAWLHHMARKLAVIHAESRGLITRERPAIWLLLASTGGPEAVRAFIDGLPVHLPVGFLYGQHINPGFEKNLVSMLDGRRGFNATLASTGDCLRAGTISITPPNEQLSIADYDALLVEPKPWPHQYQPSLEALVVQFSRRATTAGGVIVFSGMGNDGSAALRLYARQGGRIWVQSPDSCVVSSMPDSVLAMGRQLTTGSPEQLSQDFAQLYTTGESPTRPKDSSPA